MEEILSLDNHAYYFWRGDFLEDEFAFLHHVREDRALVALIRHDLER